MKKIVVYLCVGVMVMSLAACGRTEGEDPAVTENRTEDRVEQTGEPDETSGESQTNSGRVPQLSEVRSKLVEVLGDNYWPNSETDLEFLEEHGLTADLYDAYLCEMPMISDNVDTLIIIQAREGQLEAVEDALRSYRKQLVEDAAKQGMNEGKLQASRMESFGNYVCFVQLGADITEIYGENGNDEAVIRHCQEQNELALETIGKVLG